MAKVIWTDPAINDLALVFDYLAQSSRSVDQAEQFCLDLLQVAQERLWLLPDSGTLVPQLDELAV